MTTSEFGSAALSLVCFGIISSCSQRKIGSRVFPQKKSVIFRKVDVNFFAGMFCEERNGRAFGKFTFSHELSRQSCSLKFSGSKIGTNCLNQ